MTRVFRIITSASHEIPKIIIIFNKIYKQGGLYPKRPFLFFPLKSYFYLIDSSINIPCLFENNDERISV